MKNALIVIDIQNDYFPGGAFPLRNLKPPVKPPFGQLKKHVRLAG